MFARSLARKFGAVIGLALAARRRAANLRAAGQVSKCRLAGEFPFASLQNSSMEASMIRALSHLQTILSQKTDKTDFEASLLDELSSVFDEKGVRIEFSALENGLKPQMRVGATTDAIVGGGEHKTPVIYGCGKADCEFNKWR